MKKAKHRIYKKYVRWMWCIYIACITTALTFFILLSFNIFGDLPTLEELENPKYFQASQIYTSDNAVIGHFFFENRVNVNYADLSPYLVDALISTEDERFLDHSGIDPEGIMRAIVFLGRRGGASTISQQLAKMLFHKRSREFHKAVLQKFKEWVIAVRIERNFTKDEIIALYLNKFDFNYNAVGIKSASEVYFDKAPKDLNIEEAATLIGMLKNPTIFNPNRNHDTTLWRRNVVLKQMLKNGKISQEEYLLVSKKPLILNFQKPLHNEGIAPYFREILRNRLNTILNEKDAWGKYKYKNKEGKPYDLYRDGLKIYTSLNSAMQVHAEKAVKEHMSDNLQPLFDSEIKKNKQPPFSNKIKSESVEKIIDLEIKKSNRYKTLTGKFCNICGHNKTSKITEREVSYFQCNNSGCNSKVRIRKQQEIIKIFETPVSMEVFSWEGNVTKTMSPKDSILYYLSFLQTGLLSIDPHNGHIKAWVGGIDKRHFNLDHVIQSKRQVGSTIKPFLYALSLEEEKADICDEIPNIPYCINEGKWELSRNWAPNYGPKFEGYIDMRFALANSMNNYAAYLIDQVGPSSFVNFLHNIGMESDIEPVVSLCLGTADLSLYELLGAYTSIANQGTYTEPIFLLKIEDKFGNEIVSFQPKQKQVLNENTAYITLTLMKGVIEGVYNEYYGRKKSTGNSLRSKYNIKTPFAGKTGTTQNNSDGWFIGITPDLITGVWVGGENPGIRFNKTSMGMGANTGLPICALYMKSLYEDANINISQGDFEKPENFDSHIFNCKPDNINIPDIPQLNN